MQRFIPTQWWAIVLLSLVSVGLAVAVVYGGAKLSGSQPEYTNKTVSQQWDDLARLRRERIDACNRAGGLWIQGCTHNYVEPDTSWYVVPERNGWYDLADMGGVFVVVIGFLCIFAGPAVVCSVAVDKRNAIAKEQAYLESRLAANPGTP